MSIAERNASAGHDLAIVSGEVIARRWAIGMAGLLDPANADGAEWARLVPEKSDAISASGMALAGRSGQVAERLVRFTTDEALLASRACVSLASCRTPAAFVAAQLGLSFAWTARVMAQAATLSALAMRSQGDAVAPFHRAATANAHRLSRE